MHPLDPKRPTIPLRLRLVAVSVLTFLATAACAIWRPEPDPGVMCYQIVVPTDTPDPMVLCYEAPAQTPTPTQEPMVLCYEIAPVSPVLTPPASPLDTPTPTGTPQARHLLLERLLAEGRFPADVAVELRAG